MSLWQLGFRPFYLLASLLASSSVLLWSLQFTGMLGAPYLAGSVWHAHEMLFGFTLAVIVGFLFTAGRSWTNQPTPTGGALAALAALWLAARVLVLTPFGVLAAAANVAFPLACAVALAVPFWRARNRRNYFFVGLLVLFAAGALVVHLDQLHVIAVPAQAGIRLGLDVVLFILCVMGGRVIPMFTVNAIPAAGSRRDDRVERAALGSVIALLVADVAGAPDALVAGIALVATVAHAARWVLWRPWNTLRVPLVWVLHMAYAWIPLHLALRALAALGFVSSSPGTHALTAGAVGGLVIGMMTRTARGHTARVLRADAWDVAAYVLVAFAAVVRVLLPLAVPSLLADAVLASGVLWSGAFAVYAVRYWPVLTRPRLDGRPG